MESLIDSVEICISEMLNLQKLLDSSVYDIHRFPDQIKIQKWSTSVGPTTCG